MVVLALGAAHVRFTGRAEGDLGHAGDWVAVDAVRPEVAARRAAVTDRAWTWLRQVHGDRVVRVRWPGDGAGERADAAVTDQAGCALAILTADCAPVALATESGVIGAAHAGWRGILAGVLENTVDAMRRLGAGHVSAAVGPCIHAECYEFGVDDLDRMVGRLGPAVRAETATGRPALDLPAAVTLALSDAGVDVAHVDERCTACSGEHFSHRARGELERQALVVWR